MLPQIMAWQAQSVEIEGYPRIGALHELHETKQSLERNWAQSSVEEDLGFFIWRTCRTTVAKNVTTGKRLDDLRGVVGKSETRSLAHSAEKSVWRCERDLDLL